ncbi:MAG TPA: DNA-directed RNA polymerase subunit alpha C-terminal domain-containing protein [Hymenobacter sp.]|uniref:DNA-directed RNA polymerase subunit alpha C-terminal domain-containing protein n=1 Tax=Hymenobacter sp. TaxID=1898978 RepID=UPI002D7FF0CB|nr:DNA-directed RNA polymerase subunit alpha C-terminal domain-containing protein [Hymenobacter sp.]HET9502394.1 DNA-directed RNA polymerase subunit alpha C-terminal domain-containing protein [Hymenobacter sp.]
MRPLQLLSSLPSAELNEPFAGPAAGRRTGTLPPTLPVPARFVATSTHRPAPASAADAPLATARLSTKTYNALLKSRITTIGQLCRLTLHDLKWLRNLGPKAQQEITAYRAALGAPL